MKWSEIVQGVKSQISGGGIVPRATSGKVVANQTGTPQKLAPPVTDKMGRPIQAAVPIVSTLRGFPVLDDTPRVSQSIGSNRDSFQF